MFCPNCRANVPDGTAFCTSCGYNLAANAAPAAPANNAPENANSINNTINNVSGAVGNAVSSVGGAVGNAFNSIGGGAVGNAFNSFTGGPDYNPNPFSNSTWDGGVVDTIVNSIVASLIMTCTCSIAAPWAICYMMKFIISHTVIDGKRLKFDGDGGSLFAQWIKWLLLCVVTCGIYSFWVAPRLYKWVASHIHFED